MRAASAPEAGFAGEVQAARAGHRTCPRTLMLTMFGSAFESSLLTSSALLIVLLGRCAVAWLRAVAATAASAYSAVLSLHRFDFSFGSCLKPEGVCYGNTKLSGSYSNIPNYRALASR